MKKNHKGYLGRSKLVGGIKEVVKKGGWLIETEKQKEGEDN